MYTVSLYCIVLIFFVRYVFPLIDVLNCFWGHWFEYHQNIHQYPWDQWQCFSSKILLRICTSSWWTWIIVLFCSLDTKKRWQEVNRTCPISGVPTRFVMSVGWHHILSCLKKHGVYLNLWYILSHVPYRMLVVEIDEICLVWFKVTD